MLPWKDKTAHEDCRLQRIK